MAASRMAEDEDYWQRSSASTIREKGINIFGDTMTIEDTKQMLRQPVFDDNEDDAEICNWDGSNVAFSSRTGDMRSARHRPAGSAPPAGGVPAAVVRSGSGSLAGGLDKRPSPSSSSGSLVAASSDLSIDDVVGRGLPQKAPTHAEVSKLESEINFLKRSLAAAKKDRFTHIPPKETVKRILLGQPYTLELYKSKKDKLDLLDAAIACHDGNAITAAVLFLRDTVKTTIFDQQLRLRPVAVEHYINYLRLTQDVENLLNVLGMMSRNEEAAMLKYKQAVAGRAAEDKKKHLEVCYRTHFQMDMYLASEARLVQEQICLLEKQLPVEASDADKARRGDAMFKQFPRKASVVDQPVITWLYYCCFYHYTLGDTMCASPAAIRKDNNLTDKQFLWTALKARGCLKMWKDVEGLFQSKGWLGGTKMKSPIKFERVVHVLNQVHAPREVLNKYCDLIDDPTRRLEVGKKMGCHESVVRALMLLKDRQQLVAYQGKLKPNSQEWFFASDVLNTSSIKWKN